MTLKMSTETVSRSCLLYGKLPGQKKWRPFYLEATGSDLHIYEGHLKSVQTKGRQMRSLRLGQGDLVGEERSRKKKRFKFFVQRPDGRYIFKCDSAEQRGEWIIQLQRTINEQIETVLGASPGPPSSHNEEQHDIHAEQLQQANLGMGIPAEQPDLGMGIPAEQADLGKGIPAEQADLGMCRWFWGHISRAECDKRLRTEGRVGNFVVRINAEGIYVMSYLHLDGIVHSKIIHDGNVFHFDSSPVSAQGATLMDFLESYMRTQHSRKIFPLGGSLHPKVPNQGDPAVGESNKIPPRDVLRRKHSDAFTSVSTFKDLQKKPTFFTPPVRRTPLHGDIHKAVSLEQFPTSRFINVPSKRPLHERKTQQKGLAREQTDQPQMTPPVKHKPLHVVQSVPPEALPYVNTSPSSMREKEPLHQTFMTSQAMHKPLRGVQSANVHRAVSLESLPLRADYVNISPSSMREKEPLHQPIVISQAMHKPLRGVQSADVHKAVSLEALPSHSRPESPLAHMQLQYANWSSIYKNKQAETVGRGDVLSGQATESPGQEIMAVAQVNKDITTPSENTRNMDYENWEAGCAKRISMSYTEM